MKDRNRVFLIGYLLGGLTMALTIHFMGMMGWL